MKNNGLPVLILLLLLSSCVSEEGIIEKVEKTLAAFPSITKLPSHTAYPSHTKYPTFTPSHTKTITPTADPGRWQTHGPKPDGSFRYTALLVDPQTPTTVYASVSYSDYKHTYTPLYRSLDGGLTWGDIGSGLEGFSVTALTMDPVIPTRLFAGTDGYGIYRSDDGGENWISLGQGWDHRPIRQILISPNHPKIMYAVSDIHIYKSNDGGSAWRTVDSDFGGAFYGHVALNPGSASHLIAADRSRVWKSVNGGANWELVTSISLENDYEVIMDIKMDLENPATLYLLFEERILKSTNGGVTWKDENINSELYESFTTMLIDADAVYVGTYEKGVLVSENGRGDWIPLGPSDGSIMALAVDPTDPDRIYAATKEGVHFLNQSFLPDQ
jgi:photosystem II stability/assembly factor-like uncharacterized protein